MTTARPELTKPMSAESAPTPTVGVSRFSQISPRPGNLRQDDWTDGRVSATVSYRPQPVCCRLPKASRACYWECRCRHSILGPPDVPSFWCARGLGLASAIKVPGKRAMRSGLRVADPHGQNRCWRLPDHPLGDGSDEVVVDPRSAVRPHHNDVDPSLLDVFQNGRVRDAGFDGSVG